MSLREGFPVFHGYSGRLKGVLGSVFHGHSGGKIKGFFGTTCTTALGNRRDLSTRSMRMVSLARGVPALINGQPTDLQLFQLNFFNFPRTSLVLY